MLFASRSTWRARAISVALASCLGATGISGAALAQETVPEPQLREAREKFSRALALQTAGDWARALSLLKEVAAVKETPNVRFNIALSEEKLGQLVQALGDYQTALADSRAAGLKDVAAQTESRLIELRARIPQLQIKKGHGAATAVIKLDGIQIGDAALGQPRLVDPGSHVITATAPDFEPFKHAFKLSEGETEQVTITMNRASPKAEGAASEDAQRYGHDGSSNSAAWIAGGIGAAGLATSGLFFLLAADAKSELDGICEDGRSMCPGVRASEIDSKEQRGQLFTMVGNIGLAAGALGLGTATILWIFGGDSDPTADTAELKLTPGHPRAELGATLEGSF